MGSPMDRSKRANRRRRLGRIATALLTLLVLAWFVPFAYERLTTPSGRADDDWRDLQAYFYPPRPDDATEAWQEAMAKIPAPGPFDEPPPPGMQWDFRLKGSNAPAMGDVTDVLRGPWEPAARPVLRYWIRHLSSSATSAAVERLRALRERPWQYEAISIPGSGGAARVDYILLRHGARLLVAHARYEREELHDAWGAWEDLKSVLLMTGSIARATSLCSLLSSVTAAQAEEELRCWVREEALPEALAREIDKTVQSQPQAETIWPAAVEEGRVFLLDMVARRFTDDGHGNGWAVLSHQTPEYPPLSGGARRELLINRSPLWNLFSSLYHDRRTVESRVRTYHEQVAQATRLPYMEAVRQLGVLDAEGACQPADGPFFDSLARYGTSWTWVYQLQVRQDAQRRALRIMVALNRYKAEHSCYPTQLDNLVPEYIKSLPTDPFAEVPFGYQLVESADYLLYSRGIDGDDDGGRAAENGTGRARHGGEEGDDIYTFPRRKAWAPEPLAVPIAQETTSQPGTQRGGP
jgi:hypothetical protein